MRGFLCGGGHSRFGDACGLRFSSLLCRCLRSCSDRLRGMDGANGGVLLQGEGLGSEPRFGGQRWLGVRGAISLGNLNGALHNCVASRLHEVIQEGRNEEVVKEKCSSVFRGRLAC